MERSTANPRSSRSAVDSLRLPSSAHSPSPPSPPPPPPSSSLSPTTSSISPSSLPSSTTAAPSSSVPTTATTGTAASSSSKPRTTRRSSRNRDGRCTTTGATEAGAATATTATKATTSRRRRPSVAPSSSSSSPAASPVANNVGPSSVLPLPSSPGSGSGSRRVTRQTAARQAAARQLAEEEAAQLASSSAAAEFSTADAAASLPTESPSASNHASSRPTSSRKRKAPPQSSPPQPPQDQPASGRRSKRQKVPDQPSLEPAAPQPKQPAKSLRSRKTRHTAAMSSSESAAGPSNPSENAPPASSGRKSSRSKNSKKNASEETAAAAAATGTSSSSSASSSTRRSRRISSNLADQDHPMTGTDDNEKEPMPPPPPPPPELHDQEDSEDNEDNALEVRDQYDLDEEDDDPFGGFGGPSTRGEISSTLAALTGMAGMMSGLSSRLREILANLRQKEDQSLQLIALQELSELLLVSNEDNLSGHFSPDAFVRELVSLMKPDEFTEANPEIMLLACRCLANLMEALPSSVTHVVYAGAVPVLVDKLRDIEFIDLAEQALSTLEKISVEYPSSIVKEGGLAACLEYMDFFATTTQRTAVTTAANCCRNLPNDSFAVVKDAMRILRDVLKSNDQRVVEQASLCVSRIVENFRYHASKLEALVSVDLLESILRLLLPGSTNLIGPHIHTQFLRVLAATAKASPRLSAELFTMNVVETLYQTLTGVSPPNGMEDIASKLDSVLIMQALIHRPREQIIETLNVICELLPKLPDSADPTKGGFIQVGGPSQLPPVSSASGELIITPASPAPRRKTSDEKRIELLEGCKKEVCRFALILFPTLTDAFSSTVNLSVRQKVLLAQLKMLSNLDENILVEALKPVPYASFLASILSQKDHPSLVIYALQATELLVERLGNIYRYQLYREGVISEITKLAEEEVIDAKKPSIGSSQHLPLRSSTDSPPPDSSDEDGGEDHGEAEEDEDEDEEVEEEGDDGEERSHQSSDEEEEHDEDEDEENDEEDNEDDSDRDRAIPDNTSGSPASDGSTMSIDGPPRMVAHAGVMSLSCRINLAARKFLELHETEKNSKSMKKKATKILTNLSDLAAEIEAFYLRPTSAGNANPENGQRLFTKLAAYFDSDVFEGATSTELLASNIVSILEQVFNNLDQKLATAAQAAFIEAFMGSAVKSRPKTATSDSSPATPFSVMVHKLQDLLSRSEHFEVITVSSNSHGDSRSSPASMLAKQIRLKLAADDDSGIPKGYRNIMVSIHAIATFKSLEDYLRPRINTSERPRPSRSSREGGFSRALAAAAFSFGGVPSGGVRLPSRLPPLGTSTAPPAVPPAASSSRSARKAASKSQPATETPATPDAAHSNTREEKAVLRRVARRHAAVPADAQPAQPPPAGDEDLRNALECADEKRISDESEMGESSALDAIVGELDEDMDDAPTPDPSAVNLEVATSGKITARKEDGTRVPTPSHGSSTSLATRASALAGASHNTPSPSPSSRPISYAAAIQSVPQDWHMEFSYQGKVLTSETTIYRAVHKPTTPFDESLSRGVWSTIHEIKMRRVPGPPPAETLSFSGSQPDADADAAEPGEGGNTPASLARYPTTSSILRLLKMLHDLNANIDDVLVENKAALKFNAEPLSQFVNTKLTAKLNRQLEEPLIVASNCLPSWSEDLARLYPFLFPFETRHLFLQSTSFGYARSMNRWQNAQSQDESRRNRDERPFLGRLQRQKVRISRSKILESALKVMDLYGASQSILEVEYFEEVGTGLGPTLEFYSTVSREFSKKKLKLWRDTDQAEADEFVSGPNGLFPRPLGEDDAASANGERIMQLFKTLGKFVARSMLDSRMIDINFNPIFFRIGDESSGIRPSLGAMKAVDPVLARSLVDVKKFAIAKKDIAEDPNRDAAQKVADTQGITIGDGIRIEDLALDFTLPGYPEIELIPNGSQIALTLDNVDLYLERVIDMTLGSGVRLQVDAFRTGFSQVFPYSALSAFTPDELVSLFGRVEEDWTLATLMDSVKADHGFNMDSKSVKNLLQTMSELTKAQRRDFLQFTTGSPKLPIGGFKSLTPMFTVVCKPSEGRYVSDDYLPSVMTCVNYLKLPDYSDINVLRKQLFLAIKEGQGAFHLS